VIGRKTLTYEAAKFAVNVHRGATVFARVNKRRTVVTVPTAIRRKPV
jgi:hypothetical protein